MPQRKRQKWNVEKPARKRERQEFGRGRPGITLCDMCGAAYFKKRWYHGLEKLHPTNQKLPVSFIVCPACTQIKNKQFEGRIVLKNVPRKLEREVFGFVEAYGRRAWDRDPMDRVIAAKKTEEGMVITTTENQLANKIAFGPRPSDVARITVIFTS
jgi:NMD protein affecting ribosome stability and mRNA decay